MKPIICNGIDSNSFRVQKKGLAALVQSFSITVVSEYPLK